MRKFLLILLGAVLFGLPYGVHFLPDGLKKYYYSIVLPSGIVLVVIREIVLHTTRPKSMTKAELTAGLSLVRKMLTQTRVEAESIIKKLAPKGVNPGKVRVNLMLPDARRFILFKPRLQILFCAGSYTPEETSCYWETGKRGNGTCGHAWRTAMPAIYDSENPDYRRPDKALSENHMKIERFQRVRSVLSVPVISALGKNTVVAVLNFDSEQNIESTCFNHEDMIDFALGAAATYGMLIPEVRVKQ